MVRGQVQPLQAVCGLKYLFFSSSLILQPVELCHFYHTNSHYLTHIYREFGEHYPAPILLTFYIVDIESASNSASFTLLVWLILLSLIPPLCAVVIY